MRKWIGFSHLIEIMDQELTGRKGNNGGNGKSSTVSTISTISTNELRVERMKEKG